MMIFLAIGLAISAVPASLYAADTVTLEVNGQTVQTDVPPKMVNGRVMVPIRWIAEALQADVEWDAANRAVLIDTDSNLIDRSSGSSKTIELWTGGKKLSPDVPPFIEKGRVLVSVRAAAEALGADVKWISDRRLVQISKRPFEIVFADGIQFTEPAGWGLSSSYGQSGDDKQQLIDRFLERLPALLNEARIVAAAPMKEPIRKMNVDLREWVNFKGETVYGGRIELVLSADYSVVRLVMKDPAAGPIYLRLESDDLRKELAQIEAFLPEMFPIRKLELQPVPEAVFVKESPQIRQIEHHLPAGWVNGIAVNPEQDEYVAIITDLTDYQPTVWISENGADWFAANSAEFGDLRPSAVGFVPGNPAVRLLSSSIDAGIYRSVAGGTMGIGVGVPFTGSDF
jgi:hypothetical protein